MATQHGGARPGAGRKKGKVSQAKRELSEMAKDHAEAALQTLLDIARGGESEAARISSIADVAGCIVPVVKPAGPLLFGWANVFRHPGG